MLGLPDPDASPGPQIHLHFGFSGDEGGEGWTLHVADFVLRVLREMTREEVDDV